MKKYKHLIFDLDGTLTPSRELISAEMGHLLEMLKRHGYTITIVSAAEVARIKKQIAGLEVDHMLGQCGAEYFKKKMSERDEVEVWRHIKSIQKIFSEFGWGKGTDDERFVQNRGSQITFSLAGFDCNPELKKTFDANGYRRRKLLENIPFISLTLEARVAGNTSIDYNHKDYTKGKNIERLMKKLKWKKEDCVYFGDRFLSGGNDETVKGVVDHIVVAGPEDCMKQLLNFI